jgi:prepilin-type N-terminal cleavage/methylation domain-containing protein
MRSSQRHGFTLVELMIVISILGILAALVVPNLRAVTDKARAAALLERARVVRIAVVGTANLDPDSLNAPEGRVPAVLRGALADSIMLGEAGIRLQLSGARREMWLTMHAPAAGRGALVLERAFTEARREGLAVTYQGSVLQLALNPAAAATVASGTTAGGTASAPSAGTAATPPPAQPVPSGPPQITVQRIGRTFGGFERLPSLPPVVPNDPNTGRYYYSFPTPEERAAGGLRITTGPAAGLFVPLNYMVINTGNPNYGYGGYVAMSTRAQTVDVQRSDLMPRSP